MLVLGDNPALWPGTYSDLTMDDAATTPTPRRARRAPLAGAAAVVAAAAVITGSVWLHSGRTHHVATPATTPTRTAAPAPTPAPTVTPTASRAAKPSEVPQAVAKAAPTTFEIKGPKFDIKAHMCGMNNVRPLDPPGEQHHTVCWVQAGFGVAPGSRSGTTYVLGHSWAEDDQEVLNKLSEPATREVLHVKPHQASGVPIFPVKALNGYVLTLKTGRGILRYTVKDAYGVPKAQAADVKALMDEQTPNRVVIITCAELNGTDYDYNIIVDAYLTSSVATVRD
jgi:hypothetical protein